ncbi:MAG: DoxX family protein [Candidatus Neomarinimicrobiota bacterium]|tara:strand:- start:3782 stop:4147 length:366 start_codon:yes stop_codon:yes gene_type:complete
MGGTMTYYIDVIIQALKIIAAVSVYFVWVVRYDNIKKEFQTYNLPKMFRDLVGILKISFTVMLQFENNNLILVGSLGIVVLMLGAVATHLKMKNPLKDMLPAITMLSIGLIILLYTFSQAA